MTPPKKKPSFLRIIAWNANGLSNKLQEFREFVTRFQVDVALVSETHLKPSHRANVANFKCHRNDRLTGRGGGTAIYVKNNLDHYEVPLPVLEIETTAIVVNTLQGQLAIISCYNSPFNTIQKPDFPAVF